MQAQAIRGEHVDLFGCRQAPAIRLVAEISAMGLCDLAMPVLTEQRHDAGKSNSSSRDGGRVARQRAEHRLQQWHQCLNVGYRAIRCVSAPPVDAIRWT